MVLAPRAEATSGEARMRRRSEKRRCCTRRSQGSWRKLGFIRGLEGSGDDCHRRCQFGLLSQNCLAEQGGENNKTHVNIPRRQGQCDPTTTPVYAKQECANRDLFVEEQIRSSPKNLLLRCCRDGTIACFREYACIRRDVFVELRSHSIDVGAKEVMGCHGCRKGSGVVEGIERGGCEVCIVDCID